MNKTLRILIVEDSENDALLLLRALRREGYEVVYKVVETSADMRDALEKQDWDVITSDHAMPRFSAPESLALAKELRPDLPFIILSGEIDINLAVSLMKGGAQDYIQKKELPLVVPAIIRELEEAKTRIKHKQKEKQLQESELRYRELFENCGISILIIDREGKYLLVNQVAAKGLGGSPKEVTGRSMFDFLTEVTARKYLHLNRKIIDEGGSRTYEASFVLPSGERTFLITDRCLEDIEGRRYALQSCAIDITDLKKSKTFS